MAFSISIPNVLFGENTYLETGKKLKELGIKKVFCCYDKGVKAAGIADKIIKNIQSQGIKTVEFDGVIADPPDTLIDDAGEYARKENVDGVIGIGGGSSMDTAKTINLLLGNPGSISDYFDLSVPQKLGKPLILIPTTSGTGSEVTSVAVISNTKAQMKQGVLGKNCTATLAIVDPSLTIGVPKHITAATGMDVFAHAAEALTSNLNNPMSDLLGLEAITLVTKYLPIAVEDGTNIEARTKMSFASTLAGISFANSMTHLGHCIAQTIGVLYHVPHGEGCALAIPTVIEFAADIMPNKIQSIGKAMGLQLRADLSNDELASTVADAVRAINKKIGIRTMKQLNIPESDLSKIAEGTLKDGCIYFVPKKISAEEILSMLKKEYSYN